MQPHIMHVPDATRLARLKPEYATLLGLTTLLKGASVIETFSALGPDDLILFIGLGRQYDPATHPPPPRPRPLLSRTIHPGMNSSVEDKLPATHIAKYKATVH